MESFQDHVMKVLFSVYVQVFEVPDCGLNVAWFPVGATYPAYKGGCMPGLKLGGGGILLTHHIQCQTVMMSGVRLESEKYLRFPR
jgi:hypothetical protein